ncbi:Mo-dependent nitrogenase C-terminal domain-containing protein [Nostoc sp. CENA67]|uniref:Mo-dependent nitrogenase C-terminal domain-containing protein n=1 Tax=Amazonocrinis nigriterrae CENA67 TaxID=2794033 RepID=A0A8J7LAU5_9NOST|nr:Mo-dependent nitrogenase C-terminal domain-containing protein [Amazonocrinis nigriterrae]MBH8564541.1 Mo-dependent nitrogenase C-terminal domain-containing protein [Amazonocrinis nigriterrae CENA67]
MFSQTQVIPYFDLLHYLRQKLDSIAITNSRVARFFCWLIPASCPFERTIKVFERTLFHIPPLCKFNPLYEQLVGIRFRSLTYLASEGSKI